MIVPNATTHCHQYVQSLNAAHIGFWRNHNGEGIGVVELVSRMRDAELLPVPGTAACQPSMNLVGHYELVCML